MSTPVARVPSVWARLATGLACTALVGMALTPLLPRDAAGQTAPGASSQAGAAAASAPTVCQTPTISAINTETSPGSGVYSGPPAGPKGVWVQVTGTNLVSPVCQRAVYVGTVRQPNDQDTPGPITPPTPNPSPSPGASPTPTAAPSPSPTASPPGTETIYFPSNGDSGPVSVQLTDPTSSATVVSNNNLTFLAPPVISGMSTQTPTESQFIALAGSGFTAGGLNPSVGVTYYRGPASSQVGCDAEPALITDDAHMTLNAPATYCSGDAALTLETQLDTRYPISSSNMNIISVLTPAPVQVQAVVGSILPRQPSAGAAMYVIGSGFGTAGSATLRGTPLLVASWNDRAIEVDVPRDAASGALVLTRYDGTTVSAGSVTLLPAALVNPASLNAAEAAAAAAARSAAVRPPVIFNLPVPPNRPLPSGETVTGELNPAPSLSPFINHISYVTTPVGFSAFAVLGAVVLAAAFLLGFIQTGRLFLYARRSRRLAAKARVIAVERVALALHRRGRELRLGRHLRNVEVVGRTTKLGHLLLRSGTIDRHALRAALHQHRAEGRPLGEVLVARGAASEVAVWSALGDQWGITLGDLDSHWVDIDAAQRLTAVELDQVPDAGGTDHRRNRSRGHGGPVRHERPPAR